MLTLQQQMMNLLNHFTLEFILQAALNTLSLSAIGCSVGLLIGFLIACLRQTRARILLPLRVLAIVVVELLRRIPFLVTLFLIFFVFQGLGFDLSFYLIALIAVCLIASAYMAEIFRTGFESVPQTQIEAAQTLNFSYRQLVQYVIMPQAWKVVIPPAFSFMVSFIKDTALASQLGVVELTFSAKILISRGYSSFLIYGLILLIYFLMSYPLSRFGQWLEKRLAAKTQMASNAPNPGTTVTLTPP
ncbi:amino acid ABC transporter permease [Pantoea sp. BAV 3049]|uniref:amino acid ABC transporter permease n=1 Tax=Pantoea sp. BAV 3049 TaxID=2654188 RepID=UPI00131AF26F|nr:amino acid ABC transporter permease [Pantoea sp. BAV 3049]